MQTFAAFGFNKKNHVFLPYFNNENKFAEGFHYPHALEAAEHFGQTFKLFWGSNRAWEISIIKINVSETVVDFTGNLHLEAYIVLSSEFACMRLVDTRGFFTCI